MLGYELSNLEIIPFDFLFPSEKKEQKETKKNKKKKMKMRTEKKEN